ncbi:MAG: prolipoprotein diacylglyceryl transferase [Clostridia bacterium]|nr:prolipoprotein diacylglyceryl transferase [Clostridia bacterium]
MNTITTLSFPGLGIGEFDVNAIAFTLFGKLEVRWYGILITLGIVLAILYAIWRGKRNENIVFDHYIDLSFYTVFSGVVGARLYYVLTTLDTGSYKSFLDVIAIWNGGLGIYGGIIGGIIGLFVGCKIKKLPWKKVFDTVGPGVMLAQAIGRWGNFFNGECYGSEIGSTTTFDFFTAKINLPSGEGSLLHALRMGVFPSDFSDRVMLYFHPTFFYEFFWNVVGFILINVFYKHKKFDGQIAVLYLSWYGLGRVFVEGFRSDSLYIPGTQIRISQFVGALCFLVGAIYLLVVFILRRAGKKVPALEVYTPAPVEKKTSGKPFWKKVETKQNVNASAETTEAPAEKQEAAEESVEIKEEEANGNPD